MRRLFLALCLLLPATIEAKTAVADWSSADIAEFFSKQARVKVSAAAIDKANIQSDDLFDGLVDEFVLKSLGVTAVLDQKKILRAIEKLDVQLTDAPESIWDWRVANLRLCDFWLMPLASGAPSALLIWSRFFDDSTGVLDKFDDVIDQVSPFWFWTYALFFPNYPLFSLASSSPIGGFAGMIVYWVSLVRFLKDVLSLLNYTQLGSNLLGRAGKEAAAVGWALGGYYVMWHVFPKFVLDVMLYFGLYVVWPATGLFAVIALFALGAVFGADMSKKD